MAMSGATPKHLYDIGLISKLEEDEEQVPHLCTIL